MTISWSFSYNSFVKFNGNFFLGKHNMGMLYPNRCYITRCVIKGLHCSLPLLSGSMNLSKSQSFIRFHVTIFDFYIRPFWIWRRRMNLIGLPQLKPFLSFLHRITGILNQLTVTILPLHRNTLFFNIIVFYGYTHSFLSSGITGITFRRYFRIINIIIWPCKLARDHVIISVHVHCEVTAICLIIWILE